MWLLHSRKKERKIVLWEYSMGVGSESKGLIVKPGFERVKGVGF